MLRASGRTRAAAARDRRRRGFALPILVLMITAFIGLAAFAVDFSRMFVIRSQLQTAADAGALAGALQLLRQGSPIARDSAFAYTQHHRVEGATPTVGTDDIVPGTWADETFTPASSWHAASVNAVRVTTRHTGDYYFGSIYGVLDQAQRTSAVAVIGSVGGSDCVRPVAVPYASLLQALYPTGTPPTSYDLSDDDVTRLAGLTRENEIMLKVGDASSTVTSGNFFAVRQPPIQYADGTAGSPWSGANDYRNALSPGCPAHVISVGDWLQAEQGNMEGPTRQGAASLCGVTGSSAEFTCDPAVQVIVPIWDEENKSIAAPNAFRVKYIGVFAITGYTKGTGTAPGGLRGYFSSMAGHGIFEPEPGPVKRVALVR